MININFTPYVKDENAEVKNVPYYSIFSDYAAGMNDDVAEETVEEPVTTSFEEVETSNSSQLPKLKPITPPTINWNDNTLEGKSRNAKNYYMQNYGLTDFQASALIGVFRSESGLREGIENQWEKSGGNSNVKASQAGIGINQWTHKRHDDYKKWVASHGRGFKSELDFAMDEIQRKYPEFWKALRSSKSLDEATGYVYTMYTGANYRNVNASNWKRLAQRVEKPYLAMARKNGWSLDGVGFNKRLREANAVLSCKLGGILKLQGGGIGGSHIMLGELGSEKPQKVFDTNLDKEKLDFLNWYSSMAREAGLSLDPYDERHHYDYVSYYNDVVKPMGLKQWHDDWIKNGMHVGDTYKLPGHETFSVESKYYEPGMLAGHWEDDNYVPYPYTDSEMAARQYWAESRFKNNSTSEKGAMGPYQIMPDTWNEIVSKNNIIGDPYDYGTSRTVRDIIIKNLHKYPAFKKYDDTTKEALVYAAYNWGQGHVSDLLETLKNEGVDISKLDWFDRLPKQTRDYVNFVVFGRDGDNDLTNEKMTEAIRNFKQ